MLEHDVWVSYVRHHPLSWRRTVEPNRAGIQLILPCSEDGCAEWIPDVMVKDGAFMILSSSWGTVPHLCANAACSI
jgi:hypothetical protein